MIPTPLPAIFLSRSSSHQQDLGPIEYHGLERVGEEQTYLLQQLPKRVMWISLETGLLRRIYEPMERIVTDFYDCKIGDGVSGNNPADDGTTAEPLTLELRDAAGSTLTIKWRPTRNIDTGSAE